jgi:hypothetical protein
MPQHVPVGLADFLSDLEPRAIKRGVSAPIGYHVDALLKIVHDQIHDYWPLSPSHLVSAIVYSTKPDARELRQMIESYKLAKAWEVRSRLGQRTARTGTWKVPIRAQGERIS